MRDIPARMERGRFCRHNKGQSMAEFVIAAPTLLLLLLSAIQFGLIYQAKVTLNHAAFQVARTGSLSGGDPGEMKKSLVIWLTPLFTFDSSPGGIQKAAGIAQGEVDNYSKIVRVSPPDSVFGDFASGGKSLPNSALVYRPTRQGSQSGLSVQDANLLKIKVVYCQKLIVPLVGVVIHKLAAGQDGGSGLCSRPNENYLPLVSSAVMRMQTPLMR